MLQRCIPYKGPDQSRFGEIAQTILILPQVNEKRPQF
jgi:hypothetical protein